MSLSLLSLAELGLGIAALATVVLAALSDLSTRLIANRLPAVLLGLGVPHHLLRAGDWQEAAAAVGAALAVAALAFAVLYVLWRLGGMGGGDVKLFVAAAFFVGAEGFLALFVGTALAGGMLALAVLVLPLRLPPVGCHLLALLGGGTAAGATLPYGVAIACGAALAIVPTLPLLTA